MYQDQPQDYVQNLFEELMWPGHLLGRDIAGTQESVAHLTRDDSLEYADAMYRLPNVVIGAGRALDEADGRRALARGVPRPPAPSCSTPGGSARSRWRAT